MRMVRYFSASGALDQMAPQFSQPAVLPPCAPPQHPVGPLPSSGDPSAVPAGLPVAVPSAPDVASMSSSSLQDTSSSVISVTPPTANLTMLSRTATVVSNSAPSDPSPVTSTLPPVSSSVVVPGPPISMVGQPAPAVVDHDVDLLATAINKSIGEVSMEADEEVLDFGSGGAIVDEVRQVIANSVPAVPLTSLAPSSAPG